MTFEYRVPDEYFDKYVDLVETDAGLKLTVVDDGHEVSLVLADDIGVPQLRKAVTRYERQRKRR